MVRAVDRTLREGLQAKLPPHVSTLLGISEEKECLVMQGLVRTEKVVQGFDVSMANRNDVVLFVANEHRGKARCGEWFRSRGASVRFSRLAAKIGKPSRKKSSFGWIAWPRSVRRSKDCSKRREVPIHTFPAHC
jgi:hypothetical protein